MSTDPFYSFLALVTQDAHAVATRKKIAQLSQKKQIFHDTLKKLQDNLAQAQAKAHSAKKNLDAQELDIKVLKDRQRSLKNKLESASSPKEYFSLETELKSIALDIDTQENKLFELFENFETLEKNMGEIDFQVVTARAQVMQEVADIDQQINQLQQQVHDYMQSYEELKPLVNPEMLEKFLIMKQSLENPVVPVDKSACSACGHAINVQDLVSMRKHKLIACQNCFRFLYSVAP
jgi:predicted  nucleic acid-binding Zn-ribbon protein